MRVESSSESGSTAGAGSIEYDQRRQAEIDNALASGNVKGARNAASQMRGNLRKKAAELQIEEYEAAHKADEVAP